MLIKLRGFGPPTLSGPALVDDDGLPRYWAAAWASSLPANLAHETVGKKLGYLESFYHSADDLLEPGGLDNALADFDVEALCDVLEGFFLQIKYAPSITSASEDRWETALQFVMKILERIHKDSNQPNRLAEFSEKMRYLNLTSAKLHIGRRIRPERIRSLPSEVVEYLYQLLDPESSLNPFNNMDTRWRVWVAYILMLHQGLRRSELLISPVDAIKTRYDLHLNKTRHFMNVVHNGYEDDPRYSKPGIKTASSIRQLPVGDTIALIVEEYATNYRGRVNHSFLLNSQKRLPLSVEGITYYFKKITNSLPKSLRKSLQDYTGADSISAHDLRHTAAVFRLNQYMSASADMDIALQWMRVYFGWSRDSHMPLRYARAVFEDRLASVWKSEFDDRVSIVRAIPGRAYDSFSAEKK